MLWLRHLIILWSYNSGEHLCLCWFGSFLWVFAFPGPSPNSSPNHLANKPLQMTSTLYGLTNGSAMGFLEYLIR